MAEKANSQTKATAKWQEKVGYVSKSYKLKRDLVEEFKNACDKKGITQAKQLTILMKEFVESQK